MIDVTKYDGQVLLIERLILRTVAGIFEQLRQNLPEYLGVHRTQHPNQPTAGHEVQKGHWPANIEFPRGEDQGSFPVLHFKSRFALIAHLPKCTFAPPEIFLDDRLGKPRRLIGKRRCRRGPAGDERIPCRQMAGFIQLAKVEHVLIAVKTKGQARSRL